MRSQKRAAAYLVIMAAGAVVLACSGGEQDTAATRDTSAVTISAGTNPASSVQGPAVTGERSTVLFLGTSITAGLGLDPDSAYPQQIQRKIDARRLPYQIVNAGVSGETAAGLRQRLDWVLQRPAAVIVVETGANDGLRGQPVEGTKVAIRDILTRIRAAQPQARVVLAQMEAPTNLGPQYTSAYRAMFPELAREGGVQLMPFLLEGVAGVPAMNQADGVHPNNEGERRVTENVWRTLGPILGGGRR